CRLVDIEGRAYLDGASSMWCNVHGHNHPRINAAIREQLERVAHCTALGMGSDTSARLAKRLADLAPGKLEHVFFSSDGSSAIEVALKMAFQYWRQCESPQPQKTKFIALGEAYHGDTLGSASVSGIARFHALFKPLLFDVIRGPLPDARRIPENYSKADAYAYFAEEIRYLTLKHRDQVAALVIEPIVQCAAGMVMHPPGFLKELRKLTETRGILLIADEVAVGFGRTGTMFACQQEDVVPDILCLGKGLSGGYLPLAATITNNEIYGAFLGEFHEGRTLHHGHTFSGNPLACAAGLASLDLFDEERTLAMLPEKIALLSDWLCRLAEHPHVATTRQRGLIGALELTPDNSLGLPYPANERRAWRVCRETLANGVWLRPLGDVLYVMPPLAIASEDLDLLMNTLSAAIDKVTT
ncbi:MAG TPA: adenosylmethionine--8-amino-7-oxononanoate transaminase, partial [Lacipirellulaceae bacterium]|nr:adenosylmethionine--8-amino-7-oxononanoate transaminase [Lacipirellulaceae bacterium]